MPSPNITAEYKLYLKQQNYDNVLVNKQFQIAMRIERAGILRPKRRAQKRVFLLILEFNPRLPDIGMVIKNNMH